MATMIFIVVALLLAGLRLTRKADNALSSETYHMKTTSDLIIDAGEKKYLKEENGYYYGYNVKILIAKYPTRYKLNDNDSLDFNNSDRFTLDTKTGTFTKIQ